MLDKGAAREAAGVPGRGREEAEARGGAAATSPAQVLSETVSAPSAVKRSRMWLVNAAWSRSARIVARR